MAMATTEQAAGTAWLLPRNCVASNPASVELCIPVHNDIVLQTSSSCLNKETKSSRCLFWFLRIEEYLSNTLPAKWNLGKPVTKEES